MKNGERVGLVDLASAGAVATATVAGSPYAISLANPRGGSFNAGNYTLSLANGALSVTPAGLTITARNRGKEYGDVLTFAGTGFTSEGLLNGDAVSSVSLSSAGARDGGGGGFALRDRRDQRGLGAGWATTRLVICPGPWR